MTVDLTKEDIINCLLSLQLNYEVAMTTEIISFVKFDYNNHTWAFSKEICLQTDEKTLWRIYENAKRLLANLK